MGEREAEERKGNSVPLFSFACEGKKQKNKKTLPTLLSLSIRRRSLGRALVFFRFFFSSFCFVFSLNVSLSVSLLWPQKRKGNKKEM